VRTLVLIDGKRVQPGDPAVPVADLNFIPPSLIERIEVLTGGASAVYGSDAIAGVVNFIMKHNFQGLQIDAETSIGEHNNNDQQVRNANKLRAQQLRVPAPQPALRATWAGNRNTVTITGGANSPDDKGNVEFYLAYTSIQPVLEAKYDWSTCSLSTNTSNTQQQYCGGSSTDATGRLNPTSILSPYKGQNFNATGAPIPCTAVGCTGTILSPFANSQLYNFGPLNFIQRPDVRYNAGEFSHYEINPMIDLYSSFMFMDDHSVAQIGPSGSFYGGENFNIPCNDPLLNASQANTLCGAAAGTDAVSSALLGRRNIEGGGRTSDIEHNGLSDGDRFEGRPGIGLVLRPVGQYGKIGVDGHLGRLFPQFPPHKRPGCHPRSGHGRSRLRLRRRVRPLQYLDARRRDPGGPQLSQRNRHQHRLHHRASDHRNRGWGPRPIWREVAVGHRRGRHIAGRRVPPRVSTDPF